MPPKPRQRQVALVGLGLLCVLAVAGSASAASGDLDQAFTSTPGQVTTDIAGDADLANGVAVQTDGKILAVGSTLNGSNSDFALIRYKSGGLLNSSFGTAGVVTTDFGSGSDAAYAVVVKASNGKIIVVGKGFNGADNDFAVARYLSDGTPDPDFSGDGKLLTDFGSGDDVANAVALQPDGKVVVAGFAYNGTDEDFAVARYNSNGSPDTNFSGDGRQTTDFGFGGDIANGIVVQSNGMLVLAGAAYNGTDDDFALVRYSSTGNPDTGFSGDGLKMTDFGFGDDSAHALVLQTDGMLVAAGGAWNGSDGDFAIARYTTGGSLDNNFSGDGKQMTDFGFASDYANGLVLQTDGMLVAAGRAWNGSNNDFALARYTTGGTLDNNFSGDGKQTTDFAGAYDVANALALQSDGKLVAAGVADTGSDDDFALARYLTDGTLDATFSTLPGRVTTAIGAGNESAYGVAVQTDGKILAVGETDAGPNYDAALVRYKPSGALNASFGTNGIRTTDFGLSDAANAVVIKASNGKIIIAGSADNGTDNDFAVARYLSDGTPDPDFSGDGKLMTDFGFGNDFAHAVALQSDGKIVVAGQAWNGSDYDFAVARYNSNGTPDTSFSGDGLKTTDFGFGVDSANALAIQSDGKIVLAGQASNGTDLDFALVRYTSTGNPDTSFSGDGLKTTSIGSDDDVARGLVVQSNGMLVAAGYSVIGTDEEFALARYTTGGTLDNGFSGDGRQTTGFGFGDDEANALVLQPDGKLVAGGEAWNGSDFDFALARYTTSGTLDSSFSGDGKQTTDFLGDNDVAYALARQGDGKLVAAGSAYNGSDNDFALARYLP
jgi:uncharacterized delta-60 repeat protein